MSNHPIVQRLHALDRLLVREGFPATSPWWLATLERFYESARRQLVLRVGRRGGKSSTLCRIAVVEALYGEHRIPPGDIGVVAIISTTRDEASQRLRTIRAILDALSVKYRPIEGGIELVDRPVCFKVYTASIAGVSGFTCVCTICDEVSKWKDADTGANPAKEVLASLRPTMATQASARIFLSSSPLGHLDAHAEAFDRGDDSFQVTAFAPTWVANPTVTEAATHELESNEDRWRREYGAIPFEGDEASLLSAALLDRSTRSTPGDLPRERGVYYVAAMDPGFVANAWTLVIAGKRLIEGRIKRSIVCTREYRGTSSAPNNPDTILADIAKVCRTYGIEGVLSDQYEKYSLAAVALRYGIGVWQPTGGAVERLARYEGLVTQMSDGEVDLPPHKQLRADLLAIRQKLTPNGFTIHLPVTSDGRHADFAPSVVLGLAHAETPPEGPSAETPVFMSQEWEDARHVARMARQDRMRAEDGVMVDEFPAWLEGM